MNWLANAWYVAGFKHELDGGKVLARRFLGTPVVMLRHSGGQAAALEDLCPHRLMPLSAGRRIGDELQCGYHGMRFSTAGTCTLAPGQARASTQACVRTFPLAERHGLLWIWMGQPERAELDLIPDIRWNDCPGWTPSRGYHHVDADFACPSTTSWISVMRVGSIFGRSAKQKRSASQAIP